jgi:hypothetical protein
VFASTLNIGVFVLAFITLKASAEFDVIVESSWVLPVLALDDAAFVVLFDPETRIILYIKSC